MKMLSGPGGGRGLLVRVVVMTVLAALIAMVGLALARAAGDSGSTCYSQQVTPRTITPRNLPPTHSPYKEVHVQGGVPMAPGQATGNRPPVVSDVPTATTAKASATPSAASPCVSCCKSPK